MTTNEKIKDATDRVMVALTNAVLNPELAKEAIEKGSNVVREDWDDYFTALLNNELT